MVAEACHWTVEGEMGGVHEKVNKFRERGKFMNWGQEEKSRGKEEEGRRTMAKRNVREKWRKLEHSHDSYQIPNQCLHFLLSYFQLFSNCHILHL